MASVPYAFECDRASGFLADPNEHKRVGYITTLAGLAVGRQFPADLTVSVPYSGTPTYQGFPSSTTLPAGPFPRLAHVVGIMEKFSWPGGVGDPIDIDFWTSQETAVALKALQQSTLTSTRVDALGWWICDYDQEAKKWFEQSYPSSEPTVTGLVGPKGNPELNVDLTGAPAKEGIDVMVYKISISVLPAANMEYALRFANSASAQVVKSWGLVVGGLGTKAELAIVVARIAWPRAPLRESHESQFFAWSAKPPLFLLLSAQKGQDHSPSERTRLLLLE